MSTSTDLKACLILERLGTQLPRAEVDYQVVNGAHQFIIRRGGVTHRVEFPDRILAENESADLERVLPRITQKLLTERGPCRIRVGPHGGSPGIAKSLN
jgi:hypothetical protein